MALNVNNKQADKLTRKFAQIEGVGLSEAIVIAMREAIARRRASETPRQTVERVLSKHGISNSAKTRQPLPRSAYDEMWGDEDGQ